MKLYDTVKITNKRYNGKEGLITKIFPAGELADKTMIPLAPNDIEVLIHYYSCPEAHPRINAPAVQSAIDKFIEDGIFIENNCDVIRITDKGKAFVKMLCETPYPINIWTDPRTINEEIK